MFILPANFIFTEKKTRPVQDDNHAPDRIEEAIRSDIVQDSSDPQTPSDTGSPTVRYTTAKQNLETDDQGPFFSSRRTEGAARIRNKNIP